MNIRSARFFGLGLVLLSLSLLAPARALANEKVYQKLLPSTTYVRVPMGINKLSEGSGVLVDAQKKWVLTAAHVVRDLNEAQVAFPIHENGKLITNIAYYLLNPRTAMFQGKVIARNPAKDLAVIELTDLPAGAQAVPLAPTSAQPGQMIHLIGNPATEPALWLYSYGKVRQVYHKTFTSGSPDGFMQTLNCEIVSTTLPVNPGDSGGPVVNDEGQLVGIVQSFLKNSNDMNTLVDVTEVHAVLAQAKSVAVAK
jgi:S1-C subfamily serine protease